MKSVISILFAVMIFSSSLAKAESKFAVVDLQKALQSVDEGKKAKSTLEKEFNEKKKAIQAEEESLKKITEDFKKKSLVMKEDARREKEAEIQERIVKYREMFGKAQMDIQQRERELTEPIITKLRSIVQDIGEKESYSMIFEKSENGVVYFMKKDEITEKVISAYNK